MPRTLFSCGIAFAKCRRRQGFAPLDAQNAILVRHRLSKMSTSTGIRPLGCAERYSRAASPLQLCKCRRRQGFAPLDAQHAFLVRHRLCKMSTSARIRPFGCPERCSRAPWSLQNVDALRICLALPLAARVGSWLVVLGTHSAGQPTAFGWNSQSPCRGDSARGVRGCGSLKRSPHRMG